MTQSTSDYMCSVYTFSILTYNILALTKFRNEKFWEEVISTLLRYDMDRIENEASNSSSLPWVHLYRVFAQ
jgi:hypothetical protein